MFPSLPFPQAKLNKKKAAEEAKQAKAELAAKTKLEKQEALRLHRCMAVGTAVDYKVV